MSGVFQNRAAVAHEEARHQAELERFGDTPCWTWDQDAAYEIYKQFDESRPAEASECGFSESGYCLIAELLYSVPRDNDGYITDIDACLTILRQAWLSEPDRRHTIERMGHWVKTVSEFI